MRLKETEIDEKIRALNEKFQADMEALLPGLLPKLISDQDLDFGDLDFSLSDLDVMFPPTVPKTSESGERLDPVSGTKPISFRVHNRVIRAFKAQAAATGTKYQTLMHRALIDAADGFAL